MIVVHTLRDPPEEPLAHALAEFEAQFVYPLGPGRTFRIRHGQDYPRLFRAMGEARCFVAEADGHVLGTLGISLRELVTGDGFVHRAAYIGDLKIAPSARGGVVLHRLARAAFDWASPIATCAFGVVMDGSAAVPNEYTGRAGIPGFERVGTLQIVRVSSDETAQDLCGWPSPSEGWAAYERLSRGRLTYATGGDPNLRSEIEPEWITTSDGRACGRLEDTARAKRLIADDGAELESAHLACFAWSSIAAAVAVVSAARRRAARLGLPAVFVSVDARDAAVLDLAVGGASVTYAGATVYGVNVPAGLRWSISSSEI